MDERGVPCRILLVEDTEAHAEFVLRVMRTHRIANTVFHVSDGEKALRFLHNQAEFADTSQHPQPHLILLDLRLPRIDGLEVLKEIKEDEVLRHIPTVILTSSAAERDVARAYEYHANSYLVKPVDFAQFTEMLIELGWYWMMWNHT